jgi:hypothetical protein
MVQIPGLCQSCIPAISLARMDTRIAIKYLDWLNEQYIGKKIGLI